MLLKSKTFYYIISIVFYVTLLFRCSSQFGPLLKSYDASCTFSYNGTTKNIQNIFLGRCYYFLNVLHARTCYINASDYDCNDIWNSFSNSVLKKSPCELTIDDFTDLLKKVNHKLPANTSLFWSGTYTPAHELTRTREYWSLEDTFSGFLLNELTFCSKSQQNSFSYDYCPDACVTYNAPFWNAASVDFAKKAVGRVMVCLNGTRTIGALSNTSTFLKHELPQFNKDKITQVKVLLLHSPDMPKYETCKKPQTLLYLQNLLKEKEIEYTCEDNPESIQLLMCWYDPFSKECQAIKYLLNSSKSKFYFTKLNWILISLALYFIRYL